MYICKKPFKSNGKLYTYGDIINDSDVASIKLFKSKVGFGKIIEVTEQNTDMLKNYFKNKYGIDVKFSAQSEPKESVKKANTKQNATPKVAKSNTSDKDAKSNTTDSVAKL